MDQNFVIAAIVVIVAIALFIYSQKQKAASLSGGGVAVDLTDPANWQFGPIVNGTTESPNMGAIRRTANGGFAFDVPPEDGLHYLMASTKPLTGSSKITYTGNITLSPGAKLVPTTEPDGPSMMTPIFQRLGDDWTAQGAYEAYRWYGTPFTITPIKEGPFTIVADLNANWTAVLSSSKANNLAGFQQAIDNTGALGLVFGGGTGYGHGVYVVGGTATIEITGVKVE